MNDPKKDLKFVAMRLPKDLHFLAKKQALEENISLQDLITKILKEYLNSFAQN